MKQVLRFQPPILQQVTDFEPQLPEFGSKQIMPPTPLYHSESLILNLSPGIRILYTSSDWYWTLIQGIRIETKALYLHLPVYYNEPLILSSNSGNWLYLLYLHPLELSGNRFSLPYTIASHWSTHGSRIETGIISSAPYTSTSHWYRTFSYPEIEVLFPEPRVCI